MYSRQGSQEKRTTIAVSVMMFFLTLAAFDSIGFVPSYVDGVYPEPIAYADMSEVQSDSDSAPVKESQNKKIAEAVPDSAGHLALASLPQLGITTAPQASISSASKPIEPERIVIHSIGLDLPISNPTETSVEALDFALLSGTVRYPLSAKLNEEGNVFIFGHSSHIAFVKNQMFKAFNHISELKEGDTIKVSGGGIAYIYRVDTVRRTDVSDAIVDLSPTQGKRLTLSTCDSFTGKSSRFVVEADFVGAYKDE